MPYASSVGLSDVGKRLLLGRKLRSTQLGETLLPKRIALPVFASDALSSVAYAPDEILLTLSLAGLVAYSFSWKIAILVAIVMLVVVASYRQNVHAYPSGGGDYEVATVNLGPTAGLTVASALLVDYVLTVAVSISSGVANAKSILPIINGHEATVAALAALILMALNLRGVRESGTLFAVPTYCFMFGIIAMVLYGLFRILVLGENIQAHSAIYGIEPDPKYASFTGLVMVALLARAFSSGCAALTGVEAISNGVPAFKKPKSKNAATTLLLLGMISVTMLIGVITLANLTNLKLIDSGLSYYTLNGERVDVVEETAIGQLSAAIFSDFKPGFYFVVFATMIILFLAANTAFNGFPVLGSILARDGYLPRQLHTRGDRLAYSNGIVVLTFLAIVLIVAFKADVTSLIQLYVVGVFVSFTVSQLGMLRHWTRHLKTETRPGPTGPDDAVPGHQRGRPHDDRHGTRHRAHLEVPPGRLHRDHRHGCDLRDDEGDPAALSAGRRGDGAGRGRGPYAAEPSARHRAGEQAAQADLASARVRQGLPAEHSGGPDGGRRPRRDRAAGQDLGGVGHPGAAEGGRVAVP